MAWEVSISGKSGSGSGGCWMASGGAVKAYLPLSPQCVWYLEPKEGLQTELLVE